MGLEIDARSDVGLEHIKPILAIKYLTLSFSVVVSGHGV